MATDRPRPQNAMEGGVDSPVHHRDPGPLYQAVSEEGPEMAKDFSHPNQAVLPATIQQAILEHRVSDQQVLPTHTHSLH
jgi:hypothetical protein